MEEFSKIINLLKKAKDICKETDKRYEFNCPNCGGKAYVGKASSNKHMHMYCNGCKISFMQ